MKPTFRTYRTADRVAPLRHDKGGSKNGPLGEDVRAALVMYRGELMQYLGVAGKQINRRRVAADVAGGGRGTEA